MKRVIFYFDGFNFYNGLRAKSYKESQWINYYWLDFLKFCNQFVDTQNSEILQINYFTAPASNKGKQLRQTTLLNANLAVNNDIFKVVKGVFNEKEIECLATCKETFVTMEEKKTDVSIGITMLADCFEDKADRLVLISADSDQIPTLTAIKAKFPKKTIQVYFPPERSSTEIFSLCKPVIYLGDNESKFQKSMLPDIIDINGKTYTRPEKWKD